MAELLLELFSEEIPARMQARAEDDLAKLVLEKLKSERITWTPGSAKTFSTPRRVGLFVEGLPLQQPQLSEERRGPRVGAPDQAIQGFLKANLLESLDQCEKRETGKGEFWFAVIHRAGRPTVRVLEESIADVMDVFPWPKSMKWAGNDARWVRPLHSILAVFDGSPIGVTWELVKTVEALEKPTPESRIRSSNITRGHRFLAPSEITVSGFTDYKAKLRIAKVIVDPTDRRAEIERQVGERAKSEGLVVRHDPELLDEVVGLVEWPVLLMGKIDQSFMDIPPEVLTTTMRANQKYFTLLNKAGKLAPRFLVASNMQTKDGGKAIIAGNERVLRARLSDAKFFWDQDRKVRLNDRVPALKDIVFHAKLGTVADKIARLEALVVDLQPFIPGADIDQVRSAALLAKADLTSGMVGEFPELQGVMGRYYALHEGEKLAVADAIAEHYQPLGPNDRCPISPVSIAVALADKIDSLAGFFAIDEKPTGSKDPFALRRAALGVIRLIVENKLRLPLVQMFGKANQLFKNQNGAIPSLKSDELLDFFADRLKVALREKGVRHDLVSAIFSLGDEDDLVRLLARVDALKLFLDTDDGANLLVAYRRASNIVKIEEKKDKAEYNGGADAAKLQQAEEKSLHAALAAVASSGEQLIKSEHFGNAMSQLAKLRQPVDAFFDKVTVNSDDKDLRANRLRLLSQIRTTLNKVADFSQIEG